MEVNIVTVQRPSGGVNKALGWRLKALYDLPDTDPTEPAQGEAHTHATEGLSRARLWPRA